MTETVLVTGGTGFIARWCIAELLRRGYDVRTTVRDRQKVEAVRVAVEPVAPDATDRLTFAVADLTSDEGWPEAASGCDYVLHVASPLGLGGDADLIAPARDGTLRVLRAATTAGVKRVVMTSAANAASPSSYRDDTVTDEAVWTDPSAPGLIPYRRSKTLAEQAAWQYIETFSGATTMTTILPGAVFGPILGGHNDGSVQVVARLLSGRMPAIPRIGLEVVDVRDIADIHIRAMTSTRAAGERFLATGEFLWMKEIAELLRSTLGAAAAKVPTRTIPDPAVRLAARFIPDLRELTPGLGRRNRHSTAKAARLLEWHPRPAADAIIDCARSLIASGAI